MFLATVMRDYPTEVRADLQRFYGLNMDMMGRDYSILHAAACVACLPPSSATVARKYGRGLCLADVPLSVLFTSSEDDAGDVMRDAQEMDVAQLRNLLDNGNWRDVDGREYR